MTRANRPELRGRDGHFDNFDVRELEVGFVHAPLDARVGGALSVERTMRSGRGHGLWSGYGGRFELGVAGGAILDAWSADGLRGDDVARAAEGAWLSARLGISWMLFNS